MFEKNYDLVGRHSVRARFLKEDAKLFKSFYGNILGIHFTHLKDIVCFYSHSRIRTCVILKITLY